MIKAVFLDMDDTLIVNQELYSLAQAKFVGYAARMGIPAETADALIDKTDKELFATYSYSRKRFPATFETALKKLVPDADAEMIATVRGFAETVFDTVAPLKPGTPEAVELLTQHYPVYIVTQGDRGVQEARVSHLPFKDSLTDIFIVEKKSAETFETIARTLGYDPAEVLMIGDSLKSDIAPAASAGLQAAWVEARNSPLHETGSTLPAGAYKFSSVLETVRNLVANNGTLVQPAFAAPAVKKRAPSAPKP